MALSKSCGWYKTYMRNGFWLRMGITLVAMETLDDIGAFRSDLGHFCRWPCNAKSSNMKSNFTNSQLPLYSGMSRNSWKNNKRKEVVKKWQMSHSLIMSGELWAEKLKPEWKKGLKGNWVCVYKRIPILSELSNSTSCFGETWLKWWLRCFVS